MIFFFTFDILSAIAIVFDLALTIAAILAIIWLFNRIA